ncbi:hypothetical protein GCM10010193_43240 [Kitasatospora atroaurantiaca]
MIAESSSAVSRVTTRTGAPGTTTGPVAVVTVTLGSGTGLGGEVSAGDGEREGAREPRTELVHPVRSAAPSPDRTVRRGS